MTQFKRTNLTITVTCKKCNVVYAAHAIYGGVDIDEDFTMLIADACEKGDIVKLLDCEDFSFGHCKCE